MATFSESRHPQPKKNSAAPSKKIIILKTYILFLTFYWEQTLNIINEKLAIASKQRKLIRSSIFERQIRISSSIIRIISRFFEFISVSAVNLWSQRWELPKGKKNQLLCCSTRIICWLKNKKRIFRRVTEFRKFFQEFKFRIIVWNIFQFSIPF